MVNLKICGFQTNLQQFYEGSELQDISFCQNVIIMEFISDDF
jgi:hypothetical protein